MLEVPHPRRKGHLYQVYRSEQGEPEVGNALRERRAGLYADKAGELLTAEVRAANAEGMFEVERNQVWLPDETEPVLPDGLSARRRSKASLNDSILNARSGPGGRFQSAAELAPPPPPAPEPEPIPEPEPEPAPAKSSRGRRRTPAKAPAALAEPVAKSPAAAVAEPAPPAAPVPALPAPVTPPPGVPLVRALPGEKLSGTKARAGLIVPATPAVSQAPRPAAPPPRGGSRETATPAKANAKASPAGTKPSAPVTSKPAAPPPTIPPPRTGVEVVSTEIRNEVPYHSMRDLRNGSIVHNVTRYSARRLWYYAIMRHEAGPPNPQEVEWTGDVGLWRKVRRANVLRYDMVGREPDGSMRVYYGVTEDGIQGPWREIDLNAADAEQAEGEQDWG